MSIGSGSRPMFLINWHQSRSSANIWQQQSHAASNTSSCIRSSVITTSTAALQVNERVATLQGSEACLLFPSNHRKSDYVVPWPAGCCQLIITEKGRSIISYLRKCLEMHGKHVNSVVRRSSQLLTE